MLLHTVCRCSDEFILIWSMCDHLDATLTEWPEVCQAPGSLQLQMQLNAAEAATNQRHPCISTNYIVEYYNGTTVRKAYLLGLRELQQSLRNNRYRESLH